MNNIQRLGETLAKRMTKTANAAVDITAEYATINDNNSLTPDSLQVAIPEEEYIVLQDQTFNAGERVLIVWVGSDPVVIGSSSDNRPGSELTATDDGAGTVTLSIV